MARIAGLISVYATLRFPENKRGCTDREDFEIWAAVPTYKILDTMKTHSYLVVINCKNTG